MSFSGVSLPLVFVCITAFASPIIGGQVVTEPSGLSGTLGAEIFGGAALPLMTRLLLSLPILLAGFVMLRSNKVFQVAHMWLMGGLAVMAGLMTACSFVGDFAQSGLAQGLGWLIYVASCAVTVAGIGRKSGPWLVLVAIGLGCGIVGIKGVLEFVAMAHVHPGWRIFAGWNNPNAVATLFVMGIPILAALVARGSKGVSIVAGLLGAADVAALWHTESKGGLLAVAFALIVFFGVSISRRIARSALVGMATVLVLGVALIIAVRPALKANAQVKNVVEAPASRLLSSNQDTAQSFGFRILLWKSTAKLISSHPLGVGAGNFRYYSAQPGLVEQTVFSHQTWLQMAMEGTIFALVGFFVAMFLWLRALLRRDGGMPPENSILRAGVVAAIAGALAHGCLESNLYTFGAGLLFFMLLGVGIQLSATGSSPEMTSPNLRVGVAVFGLAVLFGLVTTATSELARAELMTAVEGKNREEITLAANQLRASAGEDSESLYMVGIYGSQTVDERLDFLRRATTAAPKTKYLRAYAAGLAEKGDVSGATEQYNKALGFDPNNLRTLANMYKFQDISGDKVGAADTARRLVAVEQSSVFLIRAIPDSVPVETFDARVYLAESTTDPKTAVELLEPAIRGYMRFADKTYGRVKISAAESHDEGDFVGLNLEEGKKVLERGRHAVVLYRAGALRLADQQAITLADQADRELKAD